MKVHEVFTITEKPPYDICIGIPILCLLTALNQEKALVVTFSVIVKL